MKEETACLILENVCIMDLTVFTGNNIGDTGATLLSESLKSNTTLTELNLGCEDRRRHTKETH